jgi:hypothetical protein
MHHRIDLTGLRFDTFVVVEPAPNQNGITAWHCRCDCGIEQDIPTRNLRNNEGFRCSCQKIKLIQFNGESFTLKEWADRLGISTTTLRYRLQKMSKERALTMPNWLTNARSRTVTVGDITLSINDWAWRLGVDKQVIYKRIRVGTFILTPEGKLKDDRVGGKFLLDLTGKRVGTWLILHPLPTRNNQRRWCCQCDCGVEREIGSRQLRLGKAPLCCNCSGGVEDANVNGGLVTIGDVSLTRKQWAQKLGISYYTIKQRLWRGWTIEEALTLPLLDSRHRIHRCRKVTIGKVTLSLSGWAEKLGIARSTIKIMFKNGDLQKISDMIERERVA